MSSLQNTAWQLAEEFAAPLGVSASDVMSSNRSRSVFLARAAAMKAARERYGWSYPEIGRAFGRDHTTVIAALRAETREKKEVRRRIRIAELVDAEVTLVKEPQPAPEPINPYGSTAR